MVSVLEQLNSLDIHVNLISLDNNFEHCIKSQDRLKSSIQSDRDTFTEKQDLLEDKKCMLENLNSHLGNLKSDKDNLLNLIKKNDENNEQLSKSHSVLTQELERLDAKLSEKQEECLNHYQATVLPGNNDSILNLLKNVTGVEWDLENSSANAITGFISEDRQIKKFAITCDENSNQCNELWGQLSESNQFANSLR